MSGVPQDEMAIHFKFVFRFELFLTIWVETKEKIQNKSKVKSRSSALDVKKDVGLALGHRVRVSCKNCRVVEMIPVTVFRHKCSVVTRTSPASGKSEFNHGKVRSGSNIESSRKILP